MTFLFSKTMLDISLFFVAKGAVIIYKLLVWAQLHCSLYI